jgi:hypothetical protein
MRTSNKVLLAAVALLLAAFLAFVLAMGIVTRDLLRQRGRTASAPPAAVAVSQPVSGFPQG